MAFWKAGFMDKMRAEWLRRIVKIQYQAGGTWRDEVITEKKIEGDVLKILSTTTDSENITVTGVRLLDTSGEVAGQISESIQKSSTEGVITLWEFPLFEIIETAESGKYIKAE